MKYDYRFEMSGSSHNGNTARDHTWQSFKLLALANHAGSERGEVMICGWQIGFGFAAAIPRSAHKTLPLSQLVIDNRWSSKTTKTTWITHGETYRALATDGTQWLKVAYPRRSCRGR